MAKVLLALHGFHSSPNSLKIQQMSAYLANNHPDITFIAPQLPCMPEAMWQVIEDVFTKYAKDQIAVMGSSLGGFLATKAAEQFHVKVLLINPAVYPGRLLSYAGEQQHPYTLQNYVIDNTYLNQLEVLSSVYIGTPQECWVLLQKGDEVLDYQQGLARYKQCTITCEPEGNHSFVGFERFLPDIINFLF
jgi:predicted esterase YcpF (UPF0227 family)